jgi:hypothetical protein
MSSPAQPQSAIDKILAIIDAVLEATGTLIPGYQLADALLQIVQKGVSAYEAHTGQPIDPILIKPIDPIP